MNKLTAHPPPKALIRKTGGCLLLFLAALLTPFYLPADTEGAFNRPMPSLVKVDSDAVAWKELMPGLELLELKLHKSQSQDEERLVLNVAAARQDEKADLAIVRSDPERFEYTLHMASEDGLRISLLERAKLHGLHAAINAGMYLPDNLKNTGYMRNAEHINNPRIVANFGAFFMAEPLKAKLPKADLQEKITLGDNLKSKLADYKIVIQNYRLTSLKRDVLWPDSYQSYSISALGKDNSGRMLFIVCEFPLSAPDFARVMLGLPIGGSLAMYLEGGSQAGMVVRDDAGGQPAYRSWRGRHGGLGGINFYDETPLPNVLGLKPRV